MNNNMRLSIKILLFLLPLLLFACGTTSRPDGAVQQSAKPAIFPDYTDVTIPHNIAPLNFRFEGEAERCYAEVKGADGVVKASGKGEIRFSEKQWRELLEKSRGGEIELTLFTQSDGEWQQWQPFKIYVSDRAIDSHLVYRLIEPGYEKWHIVGIYQRNLENFDQEPIIQNNMVGYNCINCHSFPNRNPDKMIFHLRAKDANGTAYIENGEVTKLNTKTPETISSLVYPYWHPSERYIVVSTNIIYQSYYYHSEDRMEVYDEKSDVVVYDVEKGEIFTNDKLSSPDAMETLPTFSPDGKSLSVSTITATVNQYGDFVTQTDVLELTSLDNTILEATKLLGKQAGLTLDTIVRDKLMAGTNVLYCPAVGTDGKETEVVTREGLTPTSQITVKVIKKAVAMLRAQNAPTINGKYVAIAHPYIIADLMNDPAWIEMHKYANPTNLYEGEIGEIAGVRFVQTTEAKVFDGGVFSTIFLGEGAYGVTEITGGGLQTIVKQKGSAGTADPLDQRSSVGWKAIKTAELLIPNYLVRVESKSATFSATAAEN